MRKNKNNKFVKLNLRRFNKNLKKSKRAVADLVLQPTFVTFLVLGILLISLMTAISNLGSNSFYEKKFASRDFALMIDSAFAAKDNVYFLYSPSSNFSFDVNKAGIVSVFEKTIKDPQKSEFKFIPGSISLNIGNLSNLETALISKTKSELKINKLDDDFNPNFFLLDCEKEIFNLANLIVDSSDVFAPDKTFKIANIFENVLRTSEFQKITLEDKLKQIKSADSVLSFAFEDNDNKKNHIKAFYNINSNKVKTSRNLACNILNQISSIYTDDIDGVSLVPLNLEHLNSNDERRILENNNQVGVFLILGNIQAPPLDISNLGNYIKKVVTNANE